MVNPILVELTRGGVVESRHRGALAVVDGRGRIIEAAGDVDAPVFPRSAVKAIQALPLVESGAADTYGFGEREIALACASHGGEEGHVELAAAMLGRAGLSEVDLECGTHWPLFDTAARDLARTDRAPSQLHNNCSGKHAGFLCTCACAGDDPRGYVGKGHAAQERVRLALEEVTGARHDPAAAGTDGCSIPTYAVPLRALAHGFARMATGEALAPARAQAARRILSACMAHPWLTSGTGRADVALMQADPGHIFTKTGAEGVFCAALPEQGLGLAVKIDDGAGRAAEAAIAAALSRHVARPEVREALGHVARHGLSNWKAIAVGEVRAVSSLS